MSAILGTAVTGAGGGAYTISNSLRIRSSASAYLSRSIGSTTSNTKWTWSAWIKLGTIPTGEQGLFGAGGGAFFNVQFWASTAGSLAIRQYNGSSDVFQLITTQLFRDPSSWYHLVVAYDSTQATASNRIKLYVNGSQVTAFSTTSYPSLNQTTYVNTSGNPMQIGRRAIGDNYWDGYIAEQYLIDGQALTPSSFGATNASTGVWQPSAYSGSYGTNGFYQKYSDVATTTASNAGLGKDFSGNGNYFVTNNISVTSGVTYDAMTDSPTPASATVGNFATWNPLSTATQGGSYTIADGNLKATEASGSTSGYVLSTITMRTGKWYWEVTGISVGSSAEVGIKANTAASLANKNGIAGTSEGFAYRANGNKVTNNSDSAYGASWTNNDVIGVAFDADAGTLTFYKNGTSQGTAFTGIASSEYFAGIGDDSFASNHTLAVNFGQQPFAQSVPSGYKRLETYNLPTPTIGASSTTLANKYFNTVTYTGTGTTQSITGVGFQPDFVWVKGRNVASSHQLYDINRGVTKQLASDLTSAEFTTTGGLTAFGSDGFTGGGVAGFNGNGNTFASWNWKGSNTTASNTSGTITSTVSVNTTSGFSVVTYTGNGSAGATVGHGLSTTPKMVIIKNRNEAAGTDWQTWFTGFGTSGTITRAYLNKVNVDSSSTNYFYPTSTTIYMGSGDHFFNSGSYNYVAYCFAEVAGFSKFGSYTGNGSTDGPFVYTGFRPAYVLIKLISSPYNWWSIKDSVRDPYNTATHALNANLSDTEYNPVDNNDFLSNGFKIRNTGTINNTNGSTYIYMAFAENPFNYSLAR